MEKNRELSVEMCTLIIKLRNEGKIISEIGIMIGKSCEKQAEIPCTKSEKRSNSERSKTCRNIFPQELFKISSQGLDIEDVYPEKSFLYLN